MERNLCLKRRDPRQTIATPQDESETEIATPTEKWRRKKKKKKNTNDKILTLSHKINYSKDYTVQFQTYLDQ